jgi:hypothetical protein
MTQLEEGRWTILSHPFADIAGMFLAASAGDLTRSLPSPSGEQRIQESSLCSR